MVLTNKRMSMFDASEVESQSMDPSAHGDGGSVASESDYDDMPGAIAPPRRGRSNSSAMHRGYRRPTSTASSPKTGDVDLSNPVTDW